MAKVYTGGTFDLFHSGHVNLLKQCKKIANGGEVVVCLNTDEFVFKFKSKKPVCSYRDREAVLLSCRYVDRVIKNTGGEDSKPTILDVKPDFIVVGSDWAKKDYYSQMMFTQEWLDKHNILLVYVPYGNYSSSTAIREKCKSV